MNGIDELIINSAFREPESYWKWDAATQGFVRAEGRRPAGYFRAIKGAPAYNDEGEFIPLPVVNQIRPRVKKWREAGYPGVTGTTRKLIEHWNNNEARYRPFFFCQLDAIETLIWLVEAHPSEKVGIRVPGDGGPFQRVCTKLCTGGGKTTVMAMLIAWMVCNKVSYRNDKRFSKNVFIVAPGLTVKSRLAVLKPGGDDSYYTQFNVVPPGMEEKLYQGKVIIANWQSLAQVSEDEIKKRKGVDKRGPISDEAWAREVLGEMSRARDILVINDEAHHAWRRNEQNPERARLSKEEKSAEQEATVWVSALDRLHKARGIRGCYDFSATPFAPSGKKNEEEALFGWIVSDFGLNDGIEAGLVKTPRVVVRDDGTLDAKTFKSKLYHIYADDTVKDNINRRAKPEEPLPDLVTQAYNLLGSDWLETFNAWKGEGSCIPPVMISVANTIETSKRIEYAFLHDRIKIPELCEAEFTKRVDSEILADAEFASLPEESAGGKRPSSKKEEAALLRETIDTVGQKGKRGEQVRNIISVGMLSEGWDAKNVTHIMGLRAFSSQLLCEQVVGRGLRRTSYDLAEGSDRFSPEYVNIFGIPFTFLPHEEVGPKPPLPIKPKTRIEAIKERAEFEISWPNIIRIDRVLKPRLYLNMEEIEPLHLDATETRLRADLAPVIDGKTDLAKCTEIDLRKLDGVLRLQSIIFETALEVYENAQAAWQREGTKLYLFGQVILLVEKYLKSGQILIDPPAFSGDPFKRKIVYMLCMNRIVRHIWNYIKVTQIEELVPIFEAKRVRSTADMQTWFTAKPCAVTQKSQISHCVFDSTWEASESYRLEKDPRVEAWAKNDHLGLKIFYIYNGVVHEYLPDFLVRLKGGKTLLLEVKGKETQKDIEKRKALAEWIEAVNGTGDYGEWSSAVSYNPADVEGIIEGVELSSKS